MDTLNGFSTQRNVLCLFDVDGTLTPPREVSCHPSNKQPIVGVSLSLEAFFFLPTAAAPSSSAAAAALSPRLHPLPPTLRRAHCVLTASRPHSYSLETFLILPPHKPEITQRVELLKNVDIVTSCHSCLFDSSFALLLIFLVSIEKECMCADLVLIKCWLLCWGLSGAIAQCVFVCLHSSRLQQSQHETSLYSHLITMLYFNDLRFFSAKGTSVIR